MIKCVEMAILYQHRIGFVAIYLVVTVIDVVVIIDLATVDLFIAVVVSNVVEIPTIVEWCCLFFQQIVLS